MKTCSNCKKDKPLSDFSIRNKKKGTPQSHCKLCCKKSNRKHYKEHVNLYKDRAKNFRIRRKKESYEYLRDYLKTHPCVDCGESDMVVLEFDHIRGKKFKAISKMITDTASIEDLTKEIKKCDVRCANCHRRKTAQTQEFYKSLSS